MNIQEIQAFKSEIRRPVVGRKIWILRERVVSIGLDGSESKTIISVSIGLERDIHNRS